MRKSGDQCGTGMWCGIRWWLQLANTAQAFGPSFPWEVQTCSEFSWCCSPEEPEPTARRDLTLRERYRVPCAFPGQQRAGRGQIQGRLPARHMGSTLHHPASATCLLKRTQSCSGTSYLSRQGLFKFTGALDRQRDQSKMRLCPD